MLKLGRYPPQKIQSSHLKSDYRIIQSRKAKMNESVYSHVNLRSEETRWINLLSVRTKKRGCCTEVAEARLYIC